MRLRNNLQNIAAAGGAEAEALALADGEFLDAVSLGQSLPGAHVVNSISYIGLKLAGVRGAIVSVVGFVVPSFLIMLGLTIAHDHLLEFSAAQLVFQGFNAAVVGLIVATTVRLGKSAMQQHWHLELGVGAAFLLIFTQAEKRTSNATV